MKHNLLKSVILSVILFMGVSNVWGNYYVANGRVVYFDNTETKWDNIYLRIGRGEAFSGYNIYCSAYEIKVGSNDNSKKVKGTANLYKYTFTNEWKGYQAFSFSNGAGWGGENNTIYQPYNDNGTIKPTSFEITGQTEFFKWNLDHTRMFIPTSEKNKDCGCTYYNTTVIDNTNTHPDYYKNTVNLVPHEGGTVTISYTNENGQNITKTDGEFTVAQTCILTVESVDPNDGYEFNQVSFFDGKHYHVKNIGDTCVVRAGTTIYPEFVTSQTTKVYLKLSNSSYWTTDDPNIAVYAFYDVYIDEESPGDWFVMHKIPSKDNNIYSCEIPKGYTGFSFVRLRPSGHNGYVADNNGFNWDNKWNQSEDLTFTEVITEYPFGKKFYNLTAQELNKKAEGEWAESQSVKLDPCGYGKYGIIFDNEVIWCPETHDMEVVEEVYIPTDAQIEIIDFDESSISPEYMRNPRYESSVIAYKGGKFLEIKQSELTNYIVDEDIWLAPNIVTSQPHTVYLHIPKEFIGDWNSTDDDFKYNTMYLTDYLSGGEIIDEDNDDKRVAHLLTAEKDLVLSDKGNGEYWRFNVPAGYNAFIIERKNNNIDGDKGEGKPGNNAYRCNWTPTFYFRSPLDEKNCFSLTGSGWIGEWREINRNYTVELGYCQFGEYSVMCNGNIYTSTTDHNVSFEAPYGSEITFAGGTPTYDIYKGGWMLRKFNGSNNETRLDVTEPYIVTGDILLDDNFVIEDPRICYLAVPKNNLGDWNQNGAGYFIWRHDQVGGFPMIGYSHQGQYFMEDNTYKYYKFTILEGCNKIYFQHKVPKNNPHENNDGNTLAGVSLKDYDIPISDKNCYYLTGKTTGYWDYLPIDDDQYRLLYVEQVVEKDKENNTVLTRKKAHPSDIFTKEDITTYTKDDGSTHDGKLLSLHVYRDRPYTGISWYDEEGKNHKYYTTKASNAGVILQKTVGGKWVDVSNNMVFGPLEAVPELALLPGRKNAASSYSSENITNLYYDDGIENIKNDEHEDEGNGVWNFVVKKDNSGNVYIALDETHRYEGEYYIRTVAAEGGWENYKTKNQMTRSDISKVHSNYSHYFCKWIGQARTDVQFTVANDYGCAISDTLMTDRTDLKGRRTSETEKIVRGLVLPKEANVRFSWNEKTNFIHRAYLGGSTHVHERFLVIKGSGKEDKDILHDTNGNTLNVGQNFTDRYGLNANEEIFNDVSNWVYYADVNMIPKAEVKLTADIQWQEGTENIEVVQHFIGSSDAYCDTILKGAGEQQYHVRMLYDFKTNELISAYVPGGQAGKEIEAIETNLMLIREENNPASQMTFKTNNMQDVGKRSYGVLELTQNTLEDDAKNVYVRSLYWISFPFDVRISDVFGFGNYGEHWIIQSYDGAKRAREGLWADSESSWVYHFDSLSLNADNEDPTDDGILKKGVGYVVALNLGAIEDSKLFKGRITTLALYFPATTTIQKHIDKEATESIEVPEHACSINRPTPKGDRRIKDSHWNVIGVPSYVNSTGTFEDNSPTEVELQFYYRWLGYYDKYEAVSAKNYGFNSMNAYMVQYAGTLNWSNVVKERIAAKRNTEAIQEHHLRLELQQNGLEQDRTFINLQEDEVTTGFDFNYDLCKINNKGANIYSLIATDTYPVEAAGNVIPVEEAIIPLGIKLDTAGEYTFAMPDGTDGIVVELIDYETNTRTNMLLDNYTVNLGKGTFDNRFALHVKPDKTSTSLEGINTNSNGVRKFIIDGTLYMQKDGVLYDAQGRKL